MTNLNRPKLRTLTVVRREHHGESFIELEDPMGLVSRLVLIPVAVYLRVVRYFDGKTPLESIQSRFLQETGRELDLTELVNLVNDLDQAMILEGSAFERLRQSYARESTRPSAMAGRSYAGNPETLRTELAALFQGPGSSGTPRVRRRPASNRFRGILCPHIDYGRGGHVYTWAYRELVEQSDAEVFVIFGVAHQPCRNRFALTRKHFETPLGTTQTDDTFVDYLSQNAGNHFFEDELTHRTEHSIEFQVIFLQYLLGKQRKFSIVPILVGSFNDLMDRGIDPITDPEVQRMVGALRDAESTLGKKVAYIGAIDLCHVGPEFEDPFLVDDPTLDQLRTFDHAMLEHAAKPDAAGWFAEASEIRNQWRVCGLAATYTLLQTIGPARGRLLRYDQAVNASRTCCVTFASMAFDAEG